MSITKLTPVEPWPTRKLPQDRFDDSVKTAMDQMSVMVDELNEHFIPETNEAIEVINEISPNIGTILDAPNQAAAAAASAQAAASSKTAAAQSATEAAASKNAAASSASSASSSKTAAAQSASEAAASASSASSSKTAAAQSASDAAEEADGAAQSASAAADSASAAASSKTAAAQSATKAAQSASNASSSKTAAAQSAATASSEADRAKDEADRAKDEADRVASIVAVDVASDTKAGIVKTDAKTLSVTDPSGTLTVEDVAIGGVLTDTARGRGQIGDCYSIPSSGVDFNTLTKAGRYWFSGSAFVNSTNKPPTNTGGFCDVLGEEGSQSYTKQIYHVYRSPVIYIREHRGITQGWSEEWTEIITEKNLATTSKVGVSKPDGVTTKTSSDGTLSVPTFAGSSVGLVPTATSADAGKALLGNGTWTKMVSETDLATTTTPGIMRPGTGLTVKDGVVSVAGAGVKTLELTESYHVLASDPPTLVVKALNSVQELYMPDPASLSGNGTTYTILVQPGANINLRDHKGYSIGPDLVVNKAYNVVLIDAENGIWARTEFAAAGVQQAGGGNLGYNLSISAPTVFWTDASSNNFKVIELSQRKYLLVQPGSSTTTAFVMSADADGQLTTGEPITFASLEGYSIYEYLVLSDSLVIIRSYTSDYPYVAQFLALSISGTTVSAGEVCAFAEAGHLAATVGVMEKMDANHFVLVWPKQDTSTSTYSGKATLFTVSGGSITAGEETTFVESYISSTSLCSIDDGKTLLFYRANDKSFFSVLELSSSGGLVIHDPSEVTLSEVLLTSRILYRNGNIVFLTHTSATDYARIVNIADNFSVRVTAANSVSNFNLVTASVVWITGGSTVVFVSSTSAVPSRITSIPSISFDSVTQISSSAFHLTDNAVSIADSHVLFGYTNSRRSSASFDLKTSGLGSIDFISYSGGLAFYNMQTLALGNGKAICFYRDDKNSNYKTAQIITI